MSTTGIRVAFAALAVTVASGVASAQGGMTPQQLERRQNVRLFGNVLISAAQHGAERMALRVRQIDPNIVLLSRITPRAQGFVIDGHGVFFYVEIPKVDPVVAWTLTNRGRDEAAISAIAGLKAFAQSLPDSPQRQMMASYVANLERHVMPFGALQSQPLQQVGSIEPDAAGRAPASPPVRPRPMDNPDHEYERLVIDQLINAMLDHSHQLGLAPDEWLTVAARGSQGQLIPEMVFDDSVTIQLRVKGSDLADLRTGRLTREEARARVVISEF